MMTKVNMHEAITHLSKLVNQALVGERHRYRAQR